MSLQVRWTFGHTLGRLTFVQMYPLGQALGQVDTWSDFRSGWPLVNVPPPGWAFRSGWHLVILWVRLTFGQMYPLGEALGQVDIWSDFGSGWPLIICTPRWGFGSGWHLVRLKFRLTFGQCASRMRSGSSWHLIKLTIRLAFGQMYPPNEALGQVDIWSDFQWDGWLAGNLQLTGWPSSNMSTWPSPGSDFGLGWHFVRWLVDWPITVGWLAGHLTTCHLCTDVKDGHLSKIWLRVRLTFCQVAGQLQLAGWLTGHLTKCQPDIGRWIPWK